MSIDTNDVERILSRVPVKDRPGVSRFINTKVAAGQTWNSLRTTTAGLVRLSGFFPGAMLKANTDVVLRALTALQAVAATPNWYVRLLREYLTFHDREDVMRKVKVNGRSSRSAAPDPSKYLTREDIAKMIGKARDVRDRALIAVLWDTGARIHEVMMLDLKDLELRGKGRDAVITAYFRKMKVRGTERRLPLHESTPTLKAYLATRKGASKDEPLFVNRMGHEGGRLTPESARAAVHVVARLARLEKPSHPHAFRHSRNYDLKRRHVSSEARALWFGWTPGSRQVDRYGASGVEDAAAEVAAQLGYRPLPPPAPVQAIEDIVRDYVPAVSAEVESIAREFAENPKLLDQLRAFIDVLKKAGPNAVVTTTK